MHEQQSRLCWRKTVGTWSCPGLHSCLIYMLQTFLTIISGVFNVGLILLAWCWVCFASEDHLGLVIDPLHCCCTVPGSSRWFEGSKWWQRRTGLNAAELIQLVEMLLFDWATELVQTLALPQWQRRQPLKVVHYESCSLSWVVCFSKQCSWQRRMCIWTPPPVVFNLDHQFGERDAAAYYPSVRVAAFLPWEIEAINAGSEVMKTPDVSVIVNDDLVTPVWND